MSAARFAVRFVSLAAGSASACGLTVEGEVFCWGGNGFGQLGTGDTERRLCPRLWRESRASRCCI
jgi:alpha-tubulin suppressor-like RCC1 family protein